MRLLRRLFALCILTPLGLAWAGLDPVQIIDQQAVAPTRVNGNAALAVASVVVGSALCLTPAWRFLRYVDTLFHEIGHATVAAAAGARVQKITVHFDASGLAAYQMPAGFGRLRRAAVAVVGYPFPAAVGVAAVVPLVSGSALWAVWYLAAVAAVAVVLLVRNVWGVAVTLLVAVCLHLVAERGHPSLVETVLGLLVGVLLVGSVRAAVEQFRLEDLRDSDAATIGRILRLPGRLVAGLHVLCCVSLVTFAGWRLLPHV